MSQWGNKDLANNVPKYLANNMPYANNVYLVDSARIANTELEVTHQGWVKVFQGTGFVKDILVSNSNPSLTYANTYLTITGANTTPANAQLIVSESNVSISINNVGAGYLDIPSISAAVANSNNSSLIFTVVPGGRMGRIQTETLVTLNNPQVSNTNSGMPYFPGL